MSWYAFFKRLLWAFSRATARLHVEGTENIPRAGPFILISNHQSFLDPIFIQSHMPRDLYTLTKSTQFADPFFRWAVPRVKGVPTRRYRVDPHVVRTVLRLLRAGEGVGIYAEGERTWDGRLQPFRRGTIRLVLKAGVPVIPCGIAGSYDVVPRWSRRLRRRDVWIRFGAPLRFGAHDDREVRDRLVPETHDRIQEAIRELAQVPGTAWAADTRSRVPSGE